MRIQSVIHTSYTTHVLLTQRHFHWLELRFPSQLFLLLVWRRAIYLISYQWQWNKSHTTWTIFCIELQINYLLKVKCYCFCSSVTSKTMRCNVQADIPKVYKKYFCGNVFEKLLIVKLIRKRMPLCCLLISLNNVVVFSSSPSGFQQI